MTEVPATARILRIEPFGPIAPILSFSKESDMLVGANRKEFGLPAYVFTDDAMRQRRLANALEYGAVGINDAVTHHATDSMPVVAPPPDGLK